MDDPVSKIIKIQNSKSYIDFVNYHKNNLIAIGKKSRDETFHTNFIAWLLGADLCVGEPNFQISKFVEMLAAIQKREKDKGTCLDAVDFAPFFLGEEKIVGVSVESEYTIPEGRLDLLLEIKTDKKTWPVVIENKVNSKENGKKGDQTEIYYKWARDKYQNKDGYADPIFVFLLPEFNRSTPKQKEFATATYQDLVDYVIEPILNRCTDPVAKSNLTMYLQCLSYQDDDEKGAKIMAISEQERKIVQKFIGENSNLIELISEVADNLDPSEKSALQSAVKNVRDKTKYDFDGQTGLSKRSMVYNVVKKYNDNKNPTWNEISVVFKDGLNGKMKKWKKHCIVKKDADIKPGDVSFDTDAPLTTRDGVDFRVNNQWSIEDIEVFVKYVNEKLKDDLGGEVTVSQQ